jgi:class 3 adenylate cyclase/tetratricopeptide (TPR) repeat protein
MRPPAACGAARRLGRVERKLATVLFADLVGSTELLTTADPEVVRRRVTRFFERVSQSVEAHGGVVEKFAGDAVMAAFGVPQAHEDDAERGARAAFAILAAVEELGLAVRIGVEAGEVVIDDGESTFATGEAVNVAARLQQAAAPGEILIGPVARDLTRGRVEVEPRGELDLRGLPHAVTAWKLICPTEEPGRGLVVGASFIGREEELELLHNTWARALRDRRGHLVTVYGEPGVGKSRIVREFLAGGERSTILSGRCLPYGEGITYWPLAEMVKAAAGISDDDPIAEAVEKLRDACGDDAVADLLGLASGLLDRFSDDSGAPEIIWAAHEWAIELAAAQPLVLCFEDIHWAEEPLLDLIEQLAERARDVPLLILCLARPELLDVRPSWGGGRLRAATIELQPLNPDESAALFDALLANGTLSAAQRAAVLEKAEGNPLFVEETIRMLLERRGDHAGDRIPDTVQALIAARIDRLPPRTKSIVQRAAVIGRVFWEGAVETLAGDDGVDAALGDLLERDFVTREHRSSISGEQAFRFKHVLIRDVAYAGLSKDARAALHQRFADWLKERAAEELVEIRAYHLDQAAALLGELDGAVPVELAQEAAAALEVAGRRALGREANRSGRKLLLRAVELEPTLQRRFQAARAAWRLADLPAVSREMERVAAEAAAAGNRAIEGGALTALAEVRLLRDGDLPRAKELAERGLSVLEPDDRFRTLMVCAKIARWQGEMDEHERYVREGLELAQRLQRIDLEAQATRELADTFMTQLRNVEAKQMVDRALALAEESGSIIGRAHALAEAGHVQIHLGELDTAEATLEEARRLFTEVGANMNVGRTLLRLGEIALERGDFTGSEKLARESIRVLKPLEDRGTLCESQRLLADALTAQGRLEEAERFALEAIETVGAHDISSQASTRFSLASVRIGQGRDEEAEVLMRDAWDRIETTGYRSLLAWAAGRLDQFLRERGRPDEAIAARYAELSAIAPGTDLASSTAPMA